MDAAGGPVILITGGSRGVGAATGRLAAARGYDVAFSFVSNEPAALAVAADMELAGSGLCPCRRTAGTPNRSLSCSPPSTEVLAG